MYSIIIKNGYAYITSHYINASNHGRFKYCKVNATNGSIDTCTNSVTNQSASEIIVKKNYIYYTINGDIYYCPITANGAPGSCSATNTFTTKGFF